MPRLAPPLVLLVFLATACSDGDLCAQAPRCDDSEAINCETACTVGPCSTGPTVQDCGDATCTVVPGSRTDARFYRSRAVCALDLKACSPADAGAPVCEGERMVRGCSAYLRDIRVPCSQAGLYFAQVPACCQGAGSQDGGSPDAGTGDGGIPDGGALPGDAA